MAVVWGTYLNATILKNCRRCSNFCTYRESNRDRTGQKQSSYPISWSGGLRLTSAICRLLHTLHLVARIIWTKVFGRTSISVGWWFGVVWTGWSSIFSKHSFRQAALIEFILLLHFFKIILVENIYSSVARNWINSFSQTAATTFAFSSVFILLLRRTANTSSPNPLKTPLGKPKGCYGYAW